MPDQFFAEWDQKGCDFDGYFGFQCMDLYQQYNKECVGGPIVYGNAIDMWDRFSTDFYYKIPNTPTNSPIKGDVVVWGQGVGQFGHIAVAKDGDTNSFTSFDENWPLGSLCHFQPHSYKNVLGWLRPGKDPATQPAPTPPTPVPPPPDPIPTVPTPPTSPETPPSTTPVPPTTVPPVLPPDQPKPPVKISFWQAILNFLKKIFG
jgi:hypothetical protein